MAKRVLRYIPWMVLVLALVLAGCGGGGEAAPGEPAAEEAAADRVEITMDSVASGVEMKIGQEAVLKLDPGYTWSANVTPVLVMSKVQDAELLEGEQAVFVAKLAGGAVVQATGKAVCAADNPPCPTPPSQLTIKIKVTP